jgi:hypothetical protein
MPHGPNAGSYSSAELCAAGRHNRVHGNYVAFFTEGDVAQKWVAVSPQVVYHRLVTHPQNNLLPISRDIETHPSRNFLKR